MQFGLIKDHEVVMNFDRPRARCYRTLAELNGNLCIIDSVNMMHFTQFMEELLFSHVTATTVVDVDVETFRRWYYG